MVEASQGQTGSMEDTHIVTEVTSQRIPIASWKYLRVSFWLEKYLKV